MIDAAKDFATLQAFIRGGLPEDERRIFEDRLAREPELVSELEQTLRMREGLRHLRARGYFDATPQRSRFPTRVPAFAAAASVVLALFVWFSRSASPAPLLMASLEARASDATASLVGAHFTFVAMRGSSTPDLELPTSGFVEFRTAPTDPAVHHYRVSLARQSESGASQTVTTVAGLTVGQDGYVHCYAEAARLDAGSYLLNVQPDTAPTSAGEVFSFNLRPRATDPAR